LADPRLGPGPLGLPSFEGLPEAAQAAWWADLARWVDGIRVAYPHLWPEPPADGEVSRRQGKPFPRCWAQHQGVVSDLCVLRTWSDGLRDGLDWAGGVQGWHEYRVFLDRVADDLQVVARMCIPAHLPAMLVPSLAKASRR
jgi:hypothetical protein